MGLFSRRRKTNTDDSDTARTTGADHDAPERSGPWDAGDLPAAAASRSRLDLGSLQVPAVNGMQVRLETDKANGVAGSVVLVLAGSSLELRAFAAPRTFGIWDELRSDILDELSRGRARTQEITGDHGIEILAQIPVRAAGGQAGVVDVRFIGVDGPRWFLRGVLQGRAATDEKAAAALREVFNDVVVVRDSQARPPREILPLHAPGQSAGPEVEDLPGLDPLAPGPTIAEVR